MDLLRHYRQVCLVAFEFSAPDGERPAPVCMVAREYFSNRLVRLFMDELRDRPPFPIDESTLFVAYFASAEIGCFLALGWDSPRRILDLWTEQRVRTNGRSGVKRGLLDTFEYYGLDSITAVEKTELRELAMGGALTLQPSGWRFSTIVKLMWTPWPACCPPCCLGSTCPAPCFAVGTWQRWRTWSLTASPSTRMPSVCCAEIGTLSRIG